MQLLDQVAVLFWRRQMNPVSVGSRKPRSVKGGYTLVTLPRIVTPYRDSVDETRARVTYQKFVTR